ncbi:MAG: Ornithine aminotransferase, partial [uncultured Pseudonocardia sp.]
RGAGRARGPRQGHPRRDDPALPAAGGDPGRAADRRRRPGRRARRAPPAL